MTCKTRRRADGRLVGRARGLAALGQGLRRCARDGRAIGSRASTSARDIADGARAAQARCRASTPCMAGPARTARSRASWRSCASPTPIRACSPRRSPCTRTAPRSCCAAAGVPVPEGRGRVAAEAAKAHAMEPPYVIKPIAEGSSVGVFIVSEDHAHPPQELSRADWAFGEQVLVRDATSPGRSSPARSWATRPSTSSKSCRPTRFYDYEAKYAPGGSSHLLPAPNFTKYLPTGARIWRLRRIARSAAGA